MKCGIRRLFLKFTFAGGILKLSGEHCLIPCIPALCIVNTYQVEATHQTIYGQGETIFCIFGIANVVCGNDLPTDIDDFGTAEAGTYTA